MTPSLVSFSTLATVPYHEMKDIEPNVGNDGTKLPFCQLLEELATMVDDTTIDGFNQALGKQRK
jgi:hypothetical protein